MKNELIKAESKIRMFLDKFDIPQDELQDVLADYREAVFKCGRQSGYNQALTETRNVFLIADSSSIIQDIHASNFVERFR